MQKLKIYRFILPAVFLFISLITQPLKGTESVPSDEIVITVTHLMDLLDAINNTRNQILDIQKKMQSTAGVGREKDLTQKISKLSKHLKQLESNFHQLATDVHLDTFDSHKRQTFDWKDEVKQLIEPLVREIKQLTSRPREIDRLETEIENLQDQLDIAQKANNRLKAITPHIKNESLHHEINQIKNNWINRYREIKTRLNITQQKLKQKQMKKKHLSEHLHELMQLFFKSRGRNMVFALLFFALTWFLMHQLQTKIHLTRPFQKHPRSVYIRTFDLIYWIATFLFSLVALLLVLYFCGDWFLLSLFIIFIVGIAWASNHALPRYWKQARIILNLGPVREGELVVYQGIPYRVSRINLASELTNERLEGGIIHLPLKDLLDMRSRPIAMNECWFPTKKDDTILLPDETVGTIMTQTPEFVCIKLLGEQIQTWATDEFLKLSPINLSDGFRIAANIHFDENHQGRLIDKMIETLTLSVQTEMENHPFHEWLISVKTILSEVGPVAFQLKIIANLKGAASLYYEDIKNVILSSCISTCNENQWRIAFYPIALPRPL
jgi:outer membrane murein-binding lipoprotein Lpp